MSTQASPWRPRPLPATRKLDPRCLAQYEALHAELLELVARLPVSVRALFEAQLLRYEGGGPCLRGPGRSLGWTGLLSRVSPGVTQEGALYDAIEVHMARQSAAIEIGVSARRFEVSTLFAMHASLLPDHPESGRVRRGPMVLEGHFIAPAPAKLAAPVRRLCELVEGGEGSPLLRAGLIHAQLVNLHPFCDANGRLARALIRVTLERADAGAGVLPVWACLAFTPTPFSPANAAYRAGRPLPWLALFYRAARSALALLRELMLLAKTLCEHESGSDERLCPAAAMALLELSSTFLDRLRVAPARPRVRALAGSSPQRA